MTLSLRQRILWGSVASTLVIVLAVFVFVDRGFHATIREGLDENVTAGARLAAELQRSEVVAGVDRAASLAAVPTLRAAVETGDPATVAENLERLLEESEVEWLAVATAEGRVLAAAGPADVDRIEAATGLLEEALYFDTADLWPEDGALLEVHASGILAGTEPLGVLVVGERIGPERVERLELSTRQRVALVSGGRLVAGGDDLSPVARDALTAAFPSEGPGDGGDAGDGLDGPAGGPTTAGTATSPDRAAPVGPRREFELGGSRYLGAAVPLPTADQGVAGHLVAYRSLDEALAPARRFRFTLVGIALGGVVLAFGLSFVVSRRVTRPVQRLLDETVRLGSGDLEHPVEPERDDEIGQLARGFETMRRSLLEAREELIRAERLSAVGRAASAIVHDFRQPVNVIQGNAELLELDWDDPEAREEDLRMIQREVRRLNTMMQEILDFARGEDRIQRSVGSVGELLEDVARRSRPQLEGRDVEIAVVCDYEGDWSLDFPRTTRVLENLVRNAASAIGSDGRIRLRSRVADGRLRIEVEDDGPGIPDELRDRLFEPFVTHGKENGTGLGLAIARSFTERQDGTIGFETSEEGTTFVLEFPSPGEVAA